MGGAFRSYSLRRLKKAAFPFGNAVSLYNFTGTSLVIQTSPGATRHS